MSSALPQRVLDAHEAIRAARKRDVFSDQADHWKVIEEEWQLILDRYPLLFTGPNIGLSCGPGWWVALEEAFAEITGILNTYQGLVFNAVQIKEKFGGLRFYYDVKRSKGSTITDDLHAEIMEKIYAVVQAAEVKAANACEVCGQPGTRRDSDWIKTLCDKHAK